MEISARIKELRKQRNLNQYALSEAVEVSVDTVRRWEKGSQVPRADELIRLASALNVKESELLNGTVKQEFEVKILMGVKSLSNVAGIEISNNAFFFGIDDNEPQIHLGGKVVIGTLEERKEAAEKILKKFWEACWMYDHKDEAEAEAPDFGTMQPA